MIKKLWDKYELLIVGTVVVLCSCWLVNVGVHNKAKRALYCQEHKTECKASDAKARAYLPRSIRRSLY